MSACLVEKLPNGSFRVSRDFASKSAAMSGMDKLLSVCEEAFIAPPREIPLPSAAAVRIDAAENED